MEHNRPRIYSKQAIIGFSVFFSTIFGGVLLFLNLRQAKKNRESYIVLAVSALATIITILIGNLQENPRSTYAYFCGFAGGCLLAYYFFPKYFPDETQYDKKPIWKPLIIGIVLTAIFVAVLIYSTIH
ncbi:MULTISPECIES: hypothetical protein [Chryseobacterium]|uniref:Peptidoglycan/LPS O-acetylase OafA/YrhL n=1 Tax=Chryseobacterium camelliae TaxID=1265445 RepID=A0ABU0TGX7_9FLAO|nr:MULTISPECIES: hypothetical protein [Chryseobacterium]MDT3405886.1 peptidoglycan/LPS O-acetylase OafA/YrhL [Pseudacidovorax intermedius]MDQ1096310.1 peptidoglycan/LPS O-acetylase OafA/YrhL [Chryseobacterium camelliae]MDQ1100249.1 peptidoglycan/LPS O-acetylase OafA/YrhL [Chryseobacterium sp. SORGH_AS_1048]MDR6087592.1 peptidoglycan/LPS O-acetylase OafA/YrhL [Chryseobacterium sp. SORGH_AS_0909]MDR6131966.1 peptidoglycan/LPS O-acetylase OafA/YrhL [Chryseobacterium sp. SORGH_AS_1175]